MYRGLTYFFLTPSPPPYKVMYVTLYYTHFSMGDRRIEAIGICGTEEGEYLLIISYNL